MSRSSDKRRAAALGTLDKALDGIGGNDAIDGLASFRLWASGARYLLDEQYAPYDRPLRSHVYESTVSHDMAADRLRLDISRTITLFGLDVQQTFSEIVNGERGHVRGVEHLAGLPGGDLLPDATAAVRRQQQLLNPHLILRAVAADPSIATSAGLAMLDGAAHELLVVPDDVYPITLWVDATTGRISRLTTRENSPLRRDVDLDVSYTDWHPTRSGPLFPTRVSLSIGGDVVLEETRTAVETGVAFDPPHFRFPASADPTYVEADARRGAVNHHWHQNFAGIGLRVDGTHSQVQAVELAPGVSHLTGAEHHSLAVEQTLGVVIIEAPLSGARSKAILDWVATRFPGKPVTHVVATHFHADHSAGLREFVAAGAAVVVGAGSAGLFRDVFTAPSSIEPDSLERQPRAANIIGVPPTGLLTLPDTTHPIVVLPLPNTHAHDLVMLHLPNDRLVFESDLFDPGLPLLFGKQWATELRDAILARGLTGATIVGGHGTTATFAELEAALEEDRASNDVQSR